MMMSADQKKDVYDIIPKSYTVESVLFQPSIIYANQVSSSENLPMIVLNYPQQGNIEVSDVGDSILFRSSMLTIHVITKNYRSGSTYINGAVIAESICDDIVSALEGLTTETTHGVRIFGKSDIVSVKNLSDQEIFDYVISINLYY